MGYILGFSGGDCALGFLLCLRSFSDVGWVGWAVGGGLFCCLFTIVYSITLFASYDSSSSTIGKLAVSGMMNAFANSLDILRRPVPGASVAIVGISTGAIGMTLGSFGFKRLIVNSVATGYGTALSGRNSSFSLGKRAALAITTLKGIRLPVIVRNRISTGRLSVSVGVAGMPLLGALGIRFRNAGWLVCGT